MTRTLLLSAFATVLFTGLCAAADESTAASNPDSFHGATADKESYKAVYQINSDDDKHIRGALKNIANALDDPRLKGKLTIELVVHGPGVQVFRKDQPYQDLLLDLQKRGVILAECENTLRERKISKDELLPFISYVPSGNGEIIIRQQQGWAIVHP